MQLVENSYATQTWVKNSMKYAIVTPSYAPDLERCQLLCKSIDRYIDDDYHHYIIVESHEYPSFLKMRNSRTTLIVVESILPPWLRRLPMAKRWWFSLKTLPVRNWIVQQVVKLSTCEFLSEEAFLFLDSDVAFIRPFTFGDFERDGLLRLFRVPHEGQLRTHIPWHRTASRLLGLPLTNYFGSTYIGHPISWRRDVLLKLHHRIEAVSGKSWVEAVCSQWHLSEYILYGIYAEHILGTSSGHYYDKIHLSHNSWDYQLKTDAQFKHFIGEIRPEHIAVMVSSKQGLSVEQYESRLLSLPRAGERSGSTGAVQESADVIVR